MRKKELTEEERIEAKRLMSKSKAAFRPPTYLREALSRWAENSGETQNEIMTCAVRDFLRKKGALN